MTEAAPPADPAPIAPRPPAAVIFDLGGVLIDWNPRHLYRKLIADPERMESFLSSVCTPAWNERMDRGEPFADAVADLAARHPQHADLIAAYHSRWPEMLNGVIAGSEEILHELDRAGVPLFAITNWSAETFVTAVDRYPLLSVFRKIVVSGPLGMAKPDREIFSHAEDQFGVPLGRCLFIDDSPANVAGARAAGLPAVRFTTPAALRADLRGHGLLAPG